MYFFFLARVAGILLALGMVLMLLLKKILNLKLALSQCHSRPAPPCEDSASQRRACFKRESTVRQCLNDRSRLYFPKRSPSAKLPFLGRIPVAQQMTPLCPRRQNFFPCGYFKPFPDRFPCFNFFIVFYSLIFFFNFFVTLWLRV